MPASNISGDLYQRLATFDLTYGAFRKNDAPMR